MLSGHPCETTRHESDTADLWCPRRANRELAMSLNLFPWDATPNTRLRVHAMSKRPVADPNNLASVAKTGPIINSNVFQLRQLNEAVFPVRYKEKFYRDVLGYPETLNRLVYLFDVVCGAYCCRIEPCQGEGETGSRCYIMVRVPPPSLPAQLLLSSSSSAVVKGRRRACRGPSPFPLFSSILHSLSLPSFELSANSCVLSRFADARCPSSIPGEKAWILDARERPNGAGLF